VNKKHDDKKGDLFKLESYESVPYHALNDFVTESSRTVAVQVLELFINLVLAPDVVLLTTTVVTSQGLVGNVLSSVHRLHSVHLGPHLIRSKAGEVGFRKSTSSRLGLEQAPSKLIGNVMS
jgi:hypothetical protein